MIRLGWVLNLDAELELADPAGHRISPTLQQRIEVQAQRFLEDAGAVSATEFRHAILDDHSGCDLAVAWCPTGRAMTRLAAQPRPYVPGPELGVLQAVNHRRFAAGLTDGIPGSRFVDDLDTALTHLQQTAPPAAGWLLKRPFGFSGRARKRVRSPLSAAEGRWIEASIDDYGGGLQIEPYVTVDREYALHGFVEPGRTALRGAVIEQVCSPDGAWLGQRGTAVDPAVTEMLHRGFEVVVEALVQAGYFGPFSIDGFSYRDPRGDRQLQPISEINARFTMGYFTGMAGSLVALGDALSRLAGPPGAQAEAPRSAPRP